jgi:hypothetical protein
MTAKERRDAADKAKYDGLTMRQVNALWTAMRYENGHRRAWVKRILPYLINEGYWDPKAPGPPPPAPQVFAGYPTARGITIIKMARGEAFAPIQEAFDRLEASRSSE